MKAMMITGAIVLALIFGAHAIGKAAAHDWYDSWCCSGQDCAPASVKYNRDGSITATNQFGSATFPPSSFRPSKDGRFHACIFGKAKQARCLYVPAGS